MKIRHWNFETGAHADVVDSEIADCMRGPEGGTQVFAVSGEFSVIFTDEEVNLIGQMTRDELIDKIRRDTIEDCECSLKAMEADPSSLGDILMQSYHEGLIREARGCTSIYEVLDVWARSGHCQGDVIPYFLGLLVWKGSQELQEYQDDIDRLLDANFIRHMDT